MERDTICAKKTFKIYNNLLKIIKHKKEHIRMYESDNRH